VTSAPGRWAWRDAGGIATLAQWLLYAEAASCTATVALASTKSFDPGAFGGVEALLWLVEFLVWIAAVIAVLRWIYLANGNAHAIGAEDMMVSPGWSVGWFFVPLANLVMPFIAMRELWKASANPKDWQAESASVTIAIWWGFWLAASLPGAISFQAGMDPAKEAGTIAEAAYLASQLLSIPAALLLASIVGKVQAMQSRFVPGSAEALKDRFA